MQIKPKMRERLDEVLDFMRGIQDEVTVDDIAATMLVTQRSARTWLHSLHREGSIFIKQWRDSPSGRGKRVAAYRPRRNKTQQDAPMWWRKP